MYIILFRSRQELEISSVWNFNSQALKQFLLMDTLNSPPNIEILFLCCLSNKLHYIHINLNLTIAKNTHIMK